MTASSLNLKGISKIYSNSMFSLKNMDLNIPRGSFTSILGPSGCGKTTTLMLIAGIEKPTTGEIWLDNINLTNLELDKREIGIVFQNYALFPNLTVRENILYGLYRQSSSQKQQRLTEMITLTHLEGLESRYPAELSGGQQQRVAIARALAPNPKLLLLDEPLSALDAWTRNSIGQELKEIQQHSGITTIMVTHDRSEALSLSDFVVVMNKGFIEQADTPLNIYDKPKSEFVATFVGGMNLVAMDLINNGQPFGIRYGDVQLRQATEASLTQPHTFVGQIQTVEFLGDTVRVSLLLNDFKSRIVADVPRTNDITKNLNIKKLLAVSMKPEYWKQWS